MQVDRVETARKQPTGEEIAEESHRRQHHPHRTNPYRNRQRRRVEDVAIKQTLHQVQAGAFSGTGRVSLRLTDVRLEPPTGSRWSRCRTSPTSEVPCAHRRRDARAGSGDGRPIAASSSSPAVRGRLGRPTLCPRKESESSSSCREFAIYYLHSRRARDATRRRPPH
jgi:hypothetical protein